MNLGLPNPSLTHQQLHRSGILKEEEMDVFLFFLGVWRLPGALGEERGCNCQVVNSSLGKGRGEQGLWDLLVGGRELSRLSCHFHPISRKLLEVILP